MKLELKYIGKDDFSMPTYEDQNKRLWKDIELGNFEQPTLCSVTGNVIDGEPNALMDEKIECVFLSKFEPIDKVKEFNYMMLGRLKADCDYYLGYGNKYPGHLWAKDEKSQILEMKLLWNNFSHTEKPEWLTWEQILDYEKMMINN